MMKVCLVIAQMFLAFGIGFGQNYQYYFGNLHSHTGFSDGSKDSLASGVSSPAGAYAYGKQSQNFDFLGVSEHNHYSSKRSPGFKLPLYQLGLSMADAANEDGSFVSLFGMEYGISSGNNGHVIIYGFNQLIGWETNVGGVSGNNYDIFNPKSDYEALFRKIKNNPSAFAYLAHPYWTDFTKNGNDSSALAFSKYNSMFDSALVGIPLRSGNAFSTFDNYNDYAFGDYFNYYKKLLYLGYHIGIGYDHDNHNTNFGRSNGGRLVILAPSLTRSNLYTAMQNMHFYGSDDSNAKIEFTLNGAIMGSICSGSVYPSVNVIHNDPDGELADTIKIWKGYANSGGLWAKIVHTSIQNNTSIFIDSNVTSNIEYYYFAEIKQGDGQWIVTSPIWYKGNAPLLVKEELALLNFNYFLNPVSKTISISHSGLDKFSIAIFDVTGKEVFQNNYFTHEICIDVSKLPTGLYTLFLKTSAGSNSKKLVIE